MTDGGVAVADEDEAKRPVELAELLSVQQRKRRRDVPHP